MKLTHAPFRCAAAGALSLLFCVPAANAMVASVYDSKTDTATALHNTSIPDGYEIWNRTVYFAAGTATYLGTSPDGRHWLLTAAHVSTQSVNKETNIVYGSVGSITTADNKSISLTAEIDDYTILKNANGTNADLKVFSIAADSISEDESIFLSAYNGINNIEIFEGKLYEPIPENSEYVRVHATYLVGTGQSFSVGDKITTGSRQKQWAQFFMDGYAKTQDGDALFVEEFSNIETSVQAGMYDSGSGVFIFDQAEQKWKIAGVTLAVDTNVEIPENTDNTKENDIALTTLPADYKENSTVEEGKDSGETVKVCITYFADLSQYAPQINAIMAIPEPSAFGLLTGTCALVLAASRRRRSRPLPLR